MKSFLSIPLLALWLSSTAVAAPELEAAHWWNEGGDRRALTVLIDEFSNRGGEWFDQLNSDHISTRESALTRMTKGYPPTVVQWNAGTEVRQFAELGLLNSITDPVLIQQYRQTLNHAVFDAIFHNGSIVALPLNIHAENWLWSKNSVKNKLGVGDIESLSQLLHVAAEIKANGIVPFAVGSEPWQQRVLFHSVLLSELGGDGYKTYMSAEQPEITDTKEFTRAVQVFRSMKPFSHAFGSGSWQEQVAAIAQGKAYGLFMGDWAKGEFMNLGLKPGVELGCQLAPGTRNLYQPVFDLFLLGNVEAGPEESGQRLLAEILLEPKVVYEFNRKKGSVPPFLSVDQSEVDACGKQVVSLLSKKGAVLPPMAMFSDGEFHNALQAAIGRVWTDESLSLSDAKDIIKAALQTEKERQLFLNAEISE